VANNVSRYLQNARLNWLKGIAYPTVPTNVYVALLTTLPSDNNGTGLVEVSGGSYARQAVSAASGWSAVTTSGSLQQMSNAGQILYPTASANWGTIVGMAIYDALTNGNLLSFAPLAAPQVVNSGNQFQFGAGNLVLQED
jgi:hypothetical protein